MQTSLLPSGFNRFPVQPEYEFIMPHRKNQFGEWVVRCYVVANGKVRRYPDCDCFETDRQAAQASHDAMVATESNRRLACQPEYSI